MDSIAEKLNVYSRLSRQILPCRNWLRRYRQHLLKPTDAHELMKPLGEAARLPNALPSEGDEGGLMVGLPFCCHAIG
jgi:hypothetical protein